MARKTCFSPVLKSRTGFDRFFSGEIPAQVASDLFSYLRSYYVVMYVAHHATCPCVEPFFVLSPFCLTLSYLSHASMVSSVFDTGMNLYTPVFVSVFYMIGSHLGYLFYPLGWVVLAGFS